MQINENIYGLKENWIDAVVNFTNNTNKNKLANFMNVPLSSTNTSVSALWRGVTEGKLTYGVPIDNTLSYCGIGQESAMSHVSYIGYNDGVKILRTDDRSVTNFAFFERRRRTNVFIPSTTDCAPITDLLRRNRINNFAWIDTLTPGTNFNVYNSPIVQINPKNICFLIQVNASKTLTSPTWIDLDTFENDTDYRYFYAARIVPYFSNNGATGRNATADAGATQDGEYNFFLNLLENYNIPEWNDFSCNIYSYVNNIVFGQLMGAQVGYYQTNNDYINIAYLTPNAKDNLHIDDVQTSTYRIYIDRYAELTEEILKTVACFGLYFTTKESVALNGSLVNNDMYIGLLDADGIGHGLYLRGADTVNAPQANYTDMSETPYNPKAKHDDTLYDNTTHFYGNLSSRAFTKMYVLTDSEVSALANELYTAVSQAPAGEEIERYNQSVFLTQNPIDCIISLKKFPCELPFSTSIPIKLGSYTCETTGSPLLYTTGIYQFSFSSAQQNSLYPVNNNSFLDYEPYTKAELSIPFCGTVEIPCSYLYDYDDLTVYLIIDYITGACTAYITAHGVAIDSTSGNAAITMPVNGLQSATLDSQIHAAAVKDTQASNGFALSLAGGAAAIIASLFTGGAAAPLIAVAGAAVGIGSAALSSQTQHESIDYELQHMQTPLKQISAASGAISQSYDMRCKLRITRPKLDSSYNKAVYADTVGFACCINTTVDKLSGLTVGTVNLDGIAATETEKQMISQAFAQGVIL